MERAQRTLAERGLIEMRPPGNPPSRRVSMTREQERGLAEQKVIEACRS
ncbi:MAG TPA: hypothetical protein VH913_14430 [Hyphomicrobiaceae bacterium]|jgi:hypothetical protein